MRPGTEFLGPSRCAEDGEGHTPLDLPAKLCSRPLLGRTGWVRRREGTHSVLCFRTFPAPFSVLATLKRKLAFSASVEKEMPFHHNRSCLPKQQQQHQHHETTQLHDIFCFPHHGIRCQVRSFSGTRVRFLGLVFLSLENTGSVGGGRHV